jgi:hypothetical protein
VGLPDLQLGDVTLDPLLVAVQCDPVSTCAMVQCAVGSAETLDSFACAKRCSLLVLALLIRMALDGYSSRSTNLSFCAHAVPMGDLQDWD